MTSQNRTEASQHTRSGGGLNVHVAMEQPREKLQLLGVLRRSCKTTAFVESALAQPTSCIRRISSLASKPVTSRTDSGGRPSHVRADAAQLGGETGYPRTIHASRRASRKQQEAANGSSPLGDRAGNNRKAGRREDFWGGRTANLGASRSAFRSLPREHFLFGLPGLPEQEMRSLALPAFPPSCSLAARAMHDARRLAWRC